MIAAARSQFVDLLARQSFLLPRVERWKLVGEVVDLPQRIGLGPHQHRLEARRRKLLDRNPFADSPQDAFAEPGWRLVGYRATDRKGNGIGGAIGGRYDQNPLGRIVQDRRDLLAGRISLAGARRPPQDAPRMLPPLFEVWQASVLAVSQHRMNAATGCRETGGQIRTRLGLFAIVVSAVQNRQKLERTHEERTRRGDRFGIIETDE